MFFEVNVNYECRTELAAEPSVLARKTEEFNENLTRKAFFSMGRRQENGMRFWLIWNETADATPYAEAYLAHLGVPDDDLQFRELTVQEMADALLGVYPRSEATTILKRFGLWYLTDRYKTSEPVSETFTQPVSREEVYRRAEDSCFTKSLLPELDRIYAAGAPTRFVGHPVQYFMYAASASEGKQLCNMLTQALYSNGRLQSKRVVYVDVECGHPVSELDSIYDTATGGVVVLRMRNFTFSKAVHVGKRHIMDMCKVVTRHSQKVLTLFWLCNDPIIRAMMHIRQAMEGYTMVSFFEQCYHGESVTREALKWAEDMGLEQPEQFAALVDADESYSHAELRSIICSTYEKYLKDNVLTAYSEIEPLPYGDDEEDDGISVIEEVPEKDSYAELQKLVGQQEAKQVMDSLLRRHKLRDAYEANGIEAQMDSMHMVFTGNPGTAKTTMARLFAKILQQKGILSSGHLVEVGRADLVGEYVGHTAPKVKEAFKKAEGGVLFIDEAYSLVDFRESSFGDEAINTIVMEMENHRKDTVVVFAGYPDKMEDFLRRNPGLKSRIAFRVRFPDYNSEELCTITCDMLEAKGFRVDKGAKAALYAYYEGLCKGEDFGNGRFARNLADKIVLQHSERLEKRDNPSKNLICTVTAKDIPTPEVKKTEQKRIGFCA